MEAEPKNNRSEPHIHLPSCVRVTCQASSSALQIARGSVRVVLPLTADAEGGDRDLKVVPVERQGMCRHLKVTLQTKDCRSINEDS